MRTPGQRPGSRPGGEGTPAEGRAACLGVPPGPGEKIPRTVTASGALSRGACRLACFRRQTAPLRHGRSGIARHGLFFCLTAASAGMCVDQKKGRNDFYENATHLDHTGGAGGHAAAGPDHLRLRLQPHRRAGQQDDRVSRLRHQHRLYGVLRPGPTVRVLRRDQCVCHLRRDRLCPVPSSFYNTAFSLLPPVIAIALALITKEVYSSLFIGILVGGRSTPTLPLRAPSSTCSATASSPSCLTATTWAS